MDQAITSQLDTFVRAYLLPFGWKLLGAAAVWVIGIAIVKMVQTASRRMMAARRLDDTLTVYLDASLGILLKALLLIAVFGVLGVETTSFAALLAAAGIAIGAAWAGLLSNFAAGLFLLFLRPFKVGDHIEAGGTEGTVREVGLFTTSIDTADNVRVSLGNNKIFSDSVRNYSTNAHRRVDLTAPIAYGIDLIDVMSRLSARVAAIDNVLPQPAPSVDILEFRPTGTILAVRSHCKDGAYWQVYFDMSRIISEVVGDAGYAVRVNGDVLRAPLWPDRAH